jgi:hypothetical protein
MKIEWPEHGLGDLLNPIDSESEDRDWIAQIRPDMAGRGHW